MFHLTLENQNNSDSDNSVIESINDYVNVRSLSFESNSYLEKYMQKNKYNELKKIKDSLSILNDDLKLKLSCNQDVFFNFIYNQVLLELKRINYSKKHYKLLYKIVINELKNREIYIYGKQYKKFIDSL